MQLILSLGRLSLLLILISCVCLALAEPNDIASGGLQVRAAKTKAKTKVKAPPVVAAKPKVKAATPKAKVTTPTTKATTPKAKVTTPKAKATTAKTAVTTPKAKPTTKTPPKTTKPPGNSTATTPSKTGAATSCPIPKKGKRAFFETDEELDAYYGIVQRDINRDVKIKGRSIEKRTNVCGFHELRDQDVANDGCQAVLPSAFVIDAATGNLVEQQVQNQPAGTACDHIIELQLVADVMQNTGACKAAELMLKAGGFKSLPEAGGISLTAKMKALIDKHVVPAVNGQRNVVFLDSGVNQAKNIYVQQFKGVATAQLPRGATVNNGAKAAQIRSYLTNAAIRVRTTTGAATLDNAIGNFLNAAKVDATKELEKRKTKAGQQCSEREQVILAQDASTIEAEPARSKQANFPSMQALWAKISDV
ncbi:hypothetical protein E1B28_013528 [Marasmius oreades]|uniref:Uncharacterized protein n=1 Tax=Marasmius oreades TaxID=181124 RepID=A0A9P7UPZ7_9AGAR|nr:uncharacterized protein E1B28_013528 [Marasmius oreades]KAG7087574.1 hypothetical protein E1B28_013528 [Marasmius oreades]